jgi:hypothetical protein
LSHPRQLIPRHDTALVPPTRASCQKHTEPHPPPTAFLQTVRFPPRSFPRQNSGSALSDSSCVTSMGWTPFPSSTATPTSTFGATTSIPARNRSQQVSPANKGYIVGLLLRRQQQDSSHANRGVHVWPSQVLMLQQSVQKSNSGRDIKLLPKPSGWPEPELM